MYSRLMTSLTLTTWGRGHEVRPFATRIGSDVVSGTLDSLQRKRTP